MQRRVRRLQGVRSSAVRVAEGETRARGSSRPASRAITGSEVITTFEVREDPAASGERTNAAAFDAHTMSAAGIGAFLGIEPHVSSHASGRGRKSSSVFAFVLEAPRSFVA